MKLLDIGEVAAKSGFKPSALRYYEDVGLIASVSRHGLRRQFAPEVLLQLKLIALGKASGFSLEEIVVMLGQDGLPNLPRDVLRQKADAIGIRIEQLTAMRDTLHHMANCRAPSHLECPSFKRLLDLPIGGPAVNSPLAGDGYRLRSMREHDQAASSAKRRR